MRLGYLLLGLFIINSGNASQNDIVLSSDKRITSIAIIDNHEPMVDLTQQKEIAYSPASEMEGNQNYTKVRKSVYDKLKQAQALLPDGLKLCVYEGYRSVGIQEKMFQKHFQQIQAANPSLPYEQIFAKTSEMIAPAKNVDGSENIPPEATGGAVSVYLLNNDGNPVDMGISPKDWAKDPTGKLSRTYSDAITSEAQHYRDTMSDAMRTVGFVNYPPVYWHWSYGDQYWAYQKNQDHAIYGVWSPEQTVNTPGDEQK